MSVHANRETYLAWAIHEVLETTDADDLGDDIAQWACLLRRARRISGVSR